MRNSILAMMLTCAFVAAPARAENHSEKPVSIDQGIGRVAWFDLATTDMAKSKDFYGKLFGWEFKAIAGTDQAVEIVMNGVSFGSIRAAYGAIGAYNGVTYIQVLDIKASCAKAKELGGFIPDGFPLDIPGGGGAIALLTDPVGHPIGMYSKATLAGAAPAAP